MQEVPLVRDKRKQGTKGYGDGMLHIGIYVKRSFSEAGNEMLQTSGVKNKI